jgi:hypothetical protein
MVRSLALLALLLLVAGCGSSSISQSAHSAPPPTIDSFRASYFGQQPSAVGQQPSASSQVAAMPQTMAAPAEQANAAPQPITADHLAHAGAAPSEADAAPPKPASPPPYKALVASYIKRYAVDSSSLKLAKIGTPFQGSVNGQKGSVVCVELGGKSGNRTAYLLKENNVVDSEFGAAACQDKKLAPWDNLGA